MFPQHHAGALTVPARPFRRLSLKDLARHRRLVAAALEPRPPTFALPPEDEWDRWLPRPPSPAPAQEVPATPPPPSPPGRPPPPPASKHPELEFLADLFSTTSSGTAAGAPNKLADSNRCLLYTPRTHHSSPHHHAPPQQQQPQPQPPAAKRPAQQAPGQPAPRKRQRTGPRLAVSPVSSCPHCRWEGYFYDDAGSAFATCPSCGYSAHEPTRSGVEGLGSWALELAHGVPGASRCRGPHSHALDPAAHPGGRWGRGSYHPTLHLRERLVLFNLLETPIVGLDWQRIEHAHRAGGCPPIVAKTDVQQLLWTLRDPAFTTRYLEKWQQIVWRLSGLRPRPLTDDEQRRLQGLFQHVCRAWETGGEDVRCRSHLPNYNYILVKLCEFIGRADMHWFFPQLKTVAKVREAERQWAAICRFLNWPFVSLFATTACPHTNALRYKAADPHARPVPLGMRRAAYPGLLDPGPPRQGGSVARLYRTVPPTEAELRQPYLAAERRRAAALNGMPNKATARLLFRLKAGPPAPGRYRRPRG